MGSTEKWEAWLPANNYVISTNRPLFSVSRIHSTRNKSPHIPFTQHTEVWVSQESRVCLPSFAVSQGREAVFPEDTNLFLGSAVTFKDLALTYKGRSGKRQTAPVNINNINQQAICLIMKWAQNTDLKYVEVCVCLCMCVFVLLQYSTSTKT